MLPLAPKCTLYATVAVWYVRHAGIGWKNVEIRSFIEGRRTEGEWKRQAD